MMEIQISRCSRSSADYNRESILIREA